MDNLEKAFPEKSSEELERIMNRYFETMGLLVADFLQEGRFTEEDYKELFVFEPSRDAYEDAVKRGGIYVLGHLGNWEMNGVGITQFQKNDLIVIAKRQSNPWTDRWVRATRKSENIDIVYTDQSPRITLKLLKEGKIVGFIADQNAGPKGPYFPFLNRLASTFQGPAVFARTLPNIPIFFLWSYYNERDQLVLGIEEMQRPKIDPKENPEAWDREFTYEWVHKLEDMVQKHPEDYFWLHRRWKSQPQNPQSVWEDWKSWQKSKT